MKEMKWAKLLSSDRFGQDEARTSPPDSRSEFDADIERVVFSGAFRRLSRKTQVHPLIANDHVHTRLTHSLEVAQVGKALGKALGKRIQTELPVGITPDDIAAIVEAACLAHDLGNPPFGHAGEEAMRHWFETNGAKLFRSLSVEHKRDLILFEGNAQGFRMITQTENHLFRGGMRLTYATLGAFMKYPWSSRKTSAKFGAFLTEESILDQVAEKLGLISKGKHAWARHPLAYLVEAADDICYAILDLEDAVELQILDFSQVADVLLLAFEEPEIADIKSKFEPASAFRINLARLRGRVFDKAVSGAIDGFMSAYEEIMTGKFDGDVYKKLDDSDRRKTLITSAKMLARDNVFPDSRKVEIELGSYSTFETLLNSFCLASSDRAQHLRSPKGEVTLGWKSGLILKLLGDHAPNEFNAPPGTTWSEYQCFRRAIDYVSGMTDNYAVYIAKQLQGMGFSGGQRP